MDEITAPLTHIAAVSWRAGAWKVQGVYPRGTEGLQGLHRGSWMFVPATVKVGDEILSDPGTTTYSDPVWAERYAAGE